MGGGYKKNKKIILFMFVYTSNLKCVTSFVRGVGFCSFVVPQVFTLSLTLVMYVGGGKFSI